MAIDLETKQQFAKELQDNPTTSERLLKSALEKRGYKFRFNEVLHGFIPDFYFPTQNKIVELDGRRFHDLTKDKKRDEYFESKGIQTFRIRSSRVFTDFKQVLRSIDIFLGEKVKPKTKKQRNKKKIKASPKKKNKVPPVLKGFKFIR